MDLMLLSDGCVSWFDCCYDLSALFRYVCVFLLNYVPIFIDIWGCLSLLSWVLLPPEKRLGCSSNFGLAVCLSDDNFWKLWHMKIIFALMFRAYGSSSYTKVIGSRSRSHEQKTWNVILPPLCLGESLTTTATPASALRHWGVASKHDDGKFHVSYPCRLYEAIRVIWIFIGWSYVPEYTHSRVVCSLLEGKLVILTL